MKIITPASIVALSRNGMGDYLQWIILLNWMATALCSTTHRYISNLLGLWIESGERPEKTAL
jgi:hypothetical protein